MSTIIVRTPRIPFTGAEGQLGRTAQGIFAAADAHRHGAENETENNAGEATEQLGERHRPFGQEPDDIRLPRPINRRVDRRSQLQHSGPRILFVRGFCTFF